MNETTPAISVVMPAFNAEKYIDRAISSILNQTFEDLELVIVDDQSTDRTWEIIQEHASRDARVRAHRNEVNSGPAATVNRAIALSSAPVVAGMDADDVSVPHRLERQLELLQSHPEIAVVGAYVSHINERDEVLSLSQTGPASIEEFEELRRRGEPTMVFGGTAMYERAKYDEVGGFDSSLRAAADIEFCDRMSELGPVVAVPEPLLRYRVYASSNVMLRFREGRRTHRFLVERRAARRAGQPLPTREQYVAKERNLPWWDRLNIWRDDFSQYHYRQAGLAFGEGDMMRTAFYLLVSGIASPLRVLRRAWHQRLSAEARRARSERHKLER